MPLHILDNKLWFPPVEDALDDGLLAAGGDVSVNRLLLAYSKGIFPWYDGPVPLWWCPDPRFVLFPEELIISKSMKALLQKDAFTFTINHAFPAVIHHCKEQPREGQNGTWITDELETSYNQLHCQGHAHSAEAWVNGKLCGGLYGVRRGKVFFGESMFSLVSNASKFALIRLVSELQKKGVELVDCQVHTNHLTSMGARMISRKEFLKFLES